MGGKFHLKLIIDKRPIANKYREGKVKRTLKRGLKVLETTKMEGIEDSIHLVCRIISHGRELGKGSRVPFFEWSLRIFISLGFIPGMCTTTPSGSAWVWSKIHSIDPSEGFKGGRGHWATNRLCYKLGSHAYFREPDQGIEGIFSIIFIPLQGFA